ncbi:MAG: hypothetical protein LBD07_04940 [Spirochaetaceae bacterium]|jgi:hypothetical protein|nr:hypothetical protein [Spirochaetaceae bacterium]
MRACSLKYGFAGVLFFLPFIPHGFFLNAADSSPEKSKDHLAVVKPSDDVLVKDSIKNIKKNPFPAIFFSNNLETIKKKEEIVPAGAATEEETKKKEKESPLNSQSLLLNNDILAYYGHPNSKGMGILGRHSKEELFERLSALAEEYKAESGGKNIIKAFYIIYATVHPEGNIGIISNDKLKEYIDFAAENDMLIFLDHQIGKYDPVESLKKMFPYLKYSNVHLALDPEWHTTKPMQELGSITADEINRAEQAMEDYIEKNEIPGERLLVIHQFNSVMIKNRKDVKADFDRVRLVLCMDGHGIPAKKRDSYAFNALATNIPIKAFKLFYNEKGNTGIDEPLLTPRQVYELSPRPVLIMYQ